MVSFAILIVTTICIRYYLAWQNKVRTDVRHQVELQNSEAEASQYDFKNLTDKENPLFVYVY